jgi:hypothetical protein
LIVVCVILTWIKLFAARAPTTGQRDVVIGVIGCDDALGALMANMAAAGVLDDTLIIITMDHG